MNNICSLQDYRLNRKRPEQAKFSNAKLNYFPKGSIARLIELIRESTTKDSQYTNHANLDIETLFYPNDLNIAADTSIGSATPDSRNLLVRIKGNLTVAATKTLTAAARKRGMFILVEGDCYLDGIISMTARGASAVGDQLELLIDKGIDYEVPALGAAGYPRVAGDHSGGNGSDGTGSQTGGGGGGGQHVNAGQTSGAGGDGTSYSGGAGAGGNIGQAGAGYDASDTGGAGSNGICTGGNDYAGGGAGNNGGSGCGAGGSAGSNGTGGLLVLIVLGKLIVGVSGTLSATGSKGGDATGAWYTAAGAGSGGGHISVFYRKIFGALTKTVTGGAIGVGSGGAMGNVNGGSGGAGSTREVQIA